MIRGQVNARREAVASIRVRGRPGGSAGATTARVCRPADGGGSIAMSDSVRAELLARLGELSRACPEMRLGQLIANLAVAARGTEPGAVWEMEDEELLAAVKWQQTELLARRGPGAEVVVNP